MSAIDFQYADPAPNFDRSKVKGVVASLVSLDAEHNNKSTALEVTAGGRLYNVVVENEQVGKQLLERGQLRKRVTIIPLNKINAFKVSAQKLAAVNRVAAGKARLALTLVGYDDEVATAMMYVFGDTVVCDDEETAKAVTFDREIGLKSVTLKGDVYDPSGTLSGGAAPSSSGILVKAQDVRRCELELREARELLHELEGEAAASRANRQAFETRAREVELKEHQTNLLRQAQEGSNAARVFTFVYSI